MKPLSNTQTFYTLKHDIASAILTINTISFYFSQEIEDRQHLGNGVRLGGCGGCFLTNAQLFSTSTTKEKA